MWKDNIMKKKYTIQPKSQYRTLYSISALHSTEYKNTSWS